MDEPATATTGDIARTLRTALEREAATRRVLSVISQSRGDAAPVFDAILANASRLCHAPLAALGLIAEDGRHYEIVAQTGATPEFMDFITANPPELDPARYVAARAMLEARTVVVDDLADPDLYGAEDRVRTQSVQLEGVRTAFYVPLIAEDRAIGALMMYRREVAPFSEDEIKLVETFAQQAVIAIENVRQFRELATRLAREAATREILEVISRSRADEGPVFDAILENAARLCDAPLAFVTMANDERTQLELKGYKGDSFPDFVDFLIKEPLPLDPKQTETARAVLECRTIQIEDLRSGKLYEHGQPHRMAAVGDGGIRTLLIVPLVLGGVGIGAFNLWRREVAPFSDSEIALVETFAAQAVIAIENVRQFRELQTRLEREKASRETLQVISRSRDDDMPVFDTILENACRLCNAPLAYLSMVTEDGAFVVSPARRGAFESFGVMLDKLRVPLAGSRLALARSIAECRVIRMDDIADDDLYRSGDPNRVSMVEDEGARSLLVVPLVSDGVGIGSITLYRREVAPFSDDDVALVEGFAAQAVIAIENVRQFRELQARLEREAATGEVLQVINRSRDDEQPVFRVILENASRLCDAPLALLAVVNEAGTHVTLPARLGMRPETTAHLDFNEPIEGSDLIAVRAIAEKRVIRIADLRTDTSNPSASRWRSELVETEGVRSIMVVPMINRDRGVGSIVLWRREVKPFSDDDLALVQAFAAQAVIAVENVRQFKALEERTRELNELNASLEDRVEEQVGEIERMGKLKRFLPAAVADAVVSQGSDQMLKSHRALLGILFCDIRGFTAFCETAEPEETIEVLQTYHREMGKLIAAHGAGVDHRMGDGIMVLFNDPLPCDDPAGEAVRLAMAMRERMAELCKGWKKLGHRLGFGVGVSLGYATVGMVGYEDRSEYTASGTAVNLAARLCDRAEDGEILLSPRAATAVEDSVKAEPAGALELKGISAPVEVFRVVAG